jgi:hypothetical protein
MIMQLSYIYIHKVLNLQINGSLQRVNCEVGYHGKELYSICILKEPRIRTFLGDLTI